jgi:rRNA maturation RNase YbeY
MQQVQSLNERFNWQELSLVCMDDEQIRALNHEYFQRDNTTDVISFAYPPVPGTEFDSGEVFVNIQQAWHEGRERKGGDFELAFYLAHGCHHLCGARDDTPREKAAMLATAEAWLEQPEAQALVPGLFHAQPEAGSTRA